MEGSRVGGNRRPLALIQASKYTADVLWFIIFDKAAGRSGWLVFIGDTCGSSPL
jgi:hypothetical protein